MDILTILFLGAIFLFTVAVIEVLYLFWTESRFAEKRTVKKRLLYISAGGKHGHDKLAVYRDRVLKDVGSMERFALKLPRVSTLDKLLLKAKMPINATTFALASIALGAAGFLAGLKFLPQIGAAVIVGILFLFIPYFILKTMERNYYHKFDEQLPEALDLLSRALKSGHALTSGIEMITDEMEEPIKSEFAATIDEVNLGLTLKEAFDNLCERVPSTDLRFFAIAVVVQKETGGNLAEILDNISRLIRERMAFGRQVKALTAEGRLSAMVLIGLPIFMFLYIYLVNYEYISLLWSEKIGLYMIAGAIVLQIVGAYFIKRIVSIEI